MGNPLRGEISETIDGKVVKFRIAANEWCELEAEFGQTTDEIITGFEQQINANKLSFSTLRSLFRASMLKQNPDVTYEEAGEMMSEMGLVEAGSLLGRVISASMPEAEEETPRPPKRGKAGAGKSS